MNTYRQRGLTLVETMVALVISLLLLAGLVTVFASMRSSFSTTRELNHLVNQQRLVSSVVGNTLANAGYWPVSDRDVRNTYLNSLAAFPATGSVTVHIPLDFTEGQVIYGTGPATSDSADVVAIRMMTGPNDKGNILDCQGGTNEGTGVERIINVLWVDTDTNQLECSTSTNGGGVVSAPLVGGDLLPVPGKKFGGVKSLAAVYGVDTNASGSVDRYMSAVTLNGSGGHICPDVTANAGNASTCWPYVRSVRLTLGFVSALAPDKTLYLTRNVVLANAIGRNVATGGGLTLPAPATGGD